MAKKIHLDEMDIQDTAEDLVKKLREFNFDKNRTLVVAVGRGGLIPAQYVAYGLGIRDMALIQSKLYDGEEKQEKKMEISGALMLDYDSYDHILVVDDLIDTGTTMEVLLDVMEQLAQEFESNAAIIPCVLYTQKSKKKTEKMGVIYGESLYRKGKKSKWLVFPWNSFIKGADS